MNAVRDVLLRLNTISLRRTRKRFTSFSGASVTVGDRPHLGCGDGRTLSQELPYLVKGDRAGQYSVRINDQWRICFVWTEQGPADVEIVH